MISRQMRAWQKERDEAADQFELELIPPRRIPELMLPPPILRVRTGKTWVLSTYERKMGFMGWMMGVWRRVTGWLLRKRAERREYKSDVENQVIKNK